MRKVTKEEISARMAKELAYSARQTEEALGRVSKVASYGKEEIRKIKDNE
jgi:hypothetical protein